MYKTSNAFDFGKPVAYDAAAKRLNLAEEGARR